MAWAGDAGAAPTTDIGDILVSITTIDRRFGPTLNTHARVMAFDLLSQQAGSLSKMIYEHPVITAHLC
jgi:hypothetical protein